MPQLCGQGGPSHARAIRKEHTFCAELGRMEHSVSTIPTLEVPTQREGTSRTVNPRALQRLDP